MQINSEVIEIDPYEQIAPLVGSLTREAVEISGYLNYLDTIDETEESSKEFISQSLDELKRLCRAFGEILEMDVLGAESDAKNFGT